MNQATGKLTLEGNESRAGSVDPYKNNTAKTAMGSATGATSKAAGQLSLTAKQLELHKSTTYETTAHRSSSGAIILNRIATTTTTKPREGTTDTNHLTKTSIDDRSKSPIQLEIDALDDIGTGANHWNSVAGQAGPNVQTSSKRKIRRIVVKRKKAGADAGPTGEN